MKTIYKVQLFMKSIKIFILVILLNYFPLSFSNSEGQRSLRGDKYWETLQLPGVEKLEFVLVVYAIFLYPVVKI